ncbi:hypothetical protein NC653_037388 [Populus alba x Populus x berolinensis]|uniref:Uncharacterized protein n=1 Tax=Populus alba x Populus x berolinensis TaxID=444605 RepID=A0AAD6PS53_9ROSI|nr:hypothetical protein NC653_037388 [Populus alba x Populus x berolinensis]
MASPAFHQGFHRQMRAPRKEIKFVVSSSREERRVRDAVVGGWSKERLVGLVSRVGGRRFWFGQETEAVGEEGGAL